MDVETKIHKFFDIADTTIKELAYDQIITWKFLSHCNLRQFQLANFYVDSFYL